MLHVTCDVIYHFLKSKMAAIYVAPVAQSIYIGKR